MITFLLGIYFMGFIASLAISKTINYFGPSSMRMEFYKIFIISLFWPIFLFFLLISYLTE